MKPKPNTLVIGYFHQCWDDEAYKNHIDAFARTYGANIIWKTDDTEVWAFCSENDDKEIEREWNKFLGEGCRKTLFEIIENHNEWIRTWAERIPLTLKVLIK